MTKKLKIKTLRQRILQTVMEIIIGIILVAISIFIITDILAYTNQITSASNQLTITISDKASKNDIIQEMKSIPYDYMTKIQVKSLTKRMFQTILQIIKKRLKPSRSLTQVTVLPISLLKILIIH